MVARREWRWLLHDRAALILIFGVPLFAFAVLTAVFSHPVIRDLGVVVVDADRSETSRAFAEEVAASPGLSIVERAGDLASAARAIRSGDAIGAVYVPADFERDLKAGRRPQVVGFYNQQFLTAAGIASSGLSDSLSRAAKRAAERAAPKASRIGSLVAETIVLVNPQRNYAQFLLRTLLPMVLHVIIALAAGYAVGSEFRRRSMRTWLACAGGNPIVALAGKLAPLFAIFFVIMLSVPLILEGLLGISFKGDVPMIVAAGSLLIVGYLALGALMQLLVRDLATGLGLTGLVVSPAFGYAGVGFPTFGHERVRAGLGRDPAGALVHGGAARAGGARIAACRIRAPVRRAGGARRALLAARVPAPARDRAEHDPQRTRCRAGSRRRRAARHRRSLRRRVAARARDPRRLHPAGGWRRWSTASITRSPISTRSCARSRSRSSTTT